MRRRIEFDHRDNGETYFAIVEGDLASLNRLFVLLANHPKIARAEQRDMGEE